MYVLAQTVGQIALPYAAYQQCRVELPHVVGIRNLPPPTLLAWTHRYGNDDDDDDDDGEDDDDVDNDDGGGGGDDEDGDHYDDGGA